jgi:hypothetical protein
MTARTAFRMPVISDATWQMTYTVRWLELLSELKPALERFETVL